MIRERPGEANDRETYIGNLDQEVDRDKYRGNFDKINWGNLTFEDFSEILNKTLESLDNYAKT